MLQCEHRAVSGRDRLSYGEYESVMNVASLRTVCVFAVATIEFGLPGGRPSTWFGRLDVSVPSATSAQSPAGKGLKPAATAVPLKTNIPYADAKAILETLREDLLPAELRALTPADRESSWDLWVTRRDEEIRGRLARGDEDSIVNFLLFGTTFTSRPRVTSRHFIARDAQVTKLDVVQRRLDDMVAGIGSPGANERLQFARKVIEREGIDPATAAGRHQARLYLEKILIRTVTERDTYDHAVGALVQLDDPIARLHESLRLYRDRGLSTDTRILPNFAVEQALEAIASERTADPGSIRRVAIVGPGLDFIDKAEGYDFYPPQTIQPFGVIDSSIRLGLSKPDDLRVTTFDLSARVNDHIEAAGDRAHAGGSYVLHLPLKTDVHWSPELVAYWKRFGDRIGQHAKSTIPPEAGGNVKVRSVRVRPAVVTTIAPRDLNVVLQRLEPLAADERFDLIIATNVLVYYDVFEQSLAVVNVAKMLRSGGLFLINNSVVGVPAVPLSMAGYRDVAYWPGVPDRMIWYRRD